ncbi:MAG: hypothetical protein HQ518_15905 [Rhodopirellula sp.]|nr:hypothetical protein [Rhodopirellula sp.]
MSETHGSKSAAMVPAVSMMIEGAIVTAVMEGTSRAADIAREAALTLLGPMQKQTK